jgi:hypothetical protein
MNKALASLGSISAMPSAAWKHRRRYLFHPSISLALLF